MFEKGSYVIYRSEGVCRITDIKSENFGIGNDAEQYYILTPLSDTRSTVFVPVKNEQLTCFMRPLMSAQEVNALVHRLKDSRLEWQSDARARTAQFKEILSSTDRERLVLMMNTLRERFDKLISEGKKISTAEQGIYARAEKLFYDELCTVTDISSQSDVRKVLSCEITLKNKE